MRSLPSSARPARRSMRRSSAGRSRTCASPRGPSSSTGMSFYVGWTKDGRRRLEVPDDDDPRTYRRGGYEVDIRFTWPDGAPFRARLRSPVTGKSASQRWGEAREMALLRAGQPTAASPEDNKEVPTLAEFWPRFIDGHCRRTDTSRAALKARRASISRHDSEPGGSIAFATKTSRRSKPTWQRTAGRRSTTC